MEDIQEIVFQILLSRMKRKKKFLRKLTELEIINLLTISKDILFDEPVLLELPSEIVIVGDLHGNIDDLIRIFERLKYPPITKYLFLGDYVDRGQNSVEVMIFLLCLKVLYPDSIYLLRGNHESRSLTNFYGFEEEVKEKYNENIYEYFIEMFYELPLCAIVGQRIFCVHGGISPSLFTLDILKNLEKPGEIGINGLFCDLVWSDPDGNIDGFQESHRGCGCLFGANVLEQFLAANDLDLLVRSHESCDEGYSWPFVEDENYAESCITIFSNSDYCERQNHASVLLVSKDLNVSIELFNYEYLYENENLLPFWLSEFIHKKESLIKSKSENINNNILLKEKNIADIQNLNVTV